MREIDGEDRADFTVDIVCDHATRSSVVAPESLVAVIYHLPTPPATIGFLEWRAARVVTGAREQDDPLETYWGAVRRLTKDMPEPQRSAILRDRDEQHKLLSRNGGRVMGSEKWNFRCADCEVTVPARYENMHPILETLRTNGVSCLPLRELRTILSK